MATRRDLFDPTDPVHMTPQQRLTELAAILSAGVIRMREQRGVNMPKVQPYRNWVGSTGSSRRRVAACMTKIPPESGEARLELSRRSSPDGQCG